MPAVFSLVLVGTTVTAERSMNVVSLEHGSFQPCKVRSGAAGGGGGGGIHE